MVNNQTSATASGYGSTTGREHEIFALILVFWQFVPGFSLVFWALGHFSSPQSPRSPECQAQSTSTHAS